MNWYVIYVKGGKERSLVNLLNKKNMHAFLPLMEKLHKKHGKYFRVLVPMYPNYIFIKTDLNQNEFNLSLINFMKQYSGVLRQLQMDKEGTSALYPEEVTLLETLMDKSYTVRHSCGLIEGNHITILNGPLCGMESRIIKIDRHKRFAYLKNELLGKPVKISLEILKKT